MDTLTLDQVVSYNLRRARELRGWTQAEAAGRVSEHLGRSWSEQVYGDAERAYRNPKRVKVFTGEEMLALALAFERPLSSFYALPSRDTQVAARGGQPVPGAKRAHALGIDSDDCRCCHGEPPSGFTCNTCGATGKR